MRHDVIQISVWHSLAMWCTLVETQAVEKGLQWHPAKLVNPLIYFCSMFAWQNIISRYKLKHISFSRSKLIIVYCRNAKSLLSLIWLQDVIGESVNYKPLFELCQWSWWLKFIRYGWQWKYCHNESSWELFHPRGIRLL